jgi:hypothetical protein
VILITAKLTQSANSAEAVKMNALFSKLVSRAKSCMYVPNVCQALYTDKEER